MINQSNLPLGLRRRDDVGGVHSLVHSIFHIVLFLHFLHTRATLHTDLQPIDKIC